MRHQLSTTYLNCKMRVLLMLMLTHVLYRRFLIFSYYMTLTRQLSKTPRMVIFILFHYIVFLNIFYLTLRISKSYYIAWLTILRTRILTVLRQITYQISMVWVKWPETLFLQYTNQVGTYLLLTRITEHSDNKSCLNLLWKFRKPEKLSKVIRQLTN